MRRLQIICHHGSHKMWANPGSSEAWESFFCSWLSVSVQKGQKRRMSGVKRLCHRPQTDHEIKPLLTSFREQLMFGADARIAQNLCLCERLTLHKLVVYVVCETRSEPSLCIRWEKRPANPLSTQPDFRRHGLWSSLSHRSLNRARSWFADSGHNSTYRRIFRQDSRLAVD